MANRLHDAVSPYLQSHADNPVDWFAWGEDAFAEAKRRGVPLLVSVGYSTCHWCHVMARESFSDPVLAAYLNENFVSVKVDREEHPDVDASYLAAAAAFTENLGWPLNVFVTPDGKPFYAGTYWPPVTVGERASFREVLTAVLDAWTNRRADVESNAGSIAAALGKRAASAIGTPLDPTLFDTVGQELARYEDRAFGGFGDAPKFPVAPVVLYLLERAAVGDREALALAGRTLGAIAGVHEPEYTPVSALRDRIGGGLFRYATAVDWTHPHYERMLYDNAQLLTAFTRLSQLDVEDDTSRDIAQGIARFLVETMQQPEGGFASAQDSESSVDGVRVEGDYYALDAAGRALQPPPALDRKILTGWNGLAIGALATAGFAFGDAHFIDAARRAADAVITGHLGDDLSLLRASIGGRPSTARATLEDYGMLAGGLLQLSLASGEAGYALVARGLIDRSLAAGGSSPFGVPGGADPVLVAQGIALDIDPSEGAYPSGLSAIAGACYSLYLLTGFAKYREASARVVELLAPLAKDRPISFGSALSLASAMQQPIDQLMIVTDDPQSPLVGVARSSVRSGSITTVVSRAQAAAFAQAGFGLFIARTREAAYLCRSFVCRLPLTDADSLREALVARQG